MIEHDLEDGYKLKLTMAFGRLNPMLYQGYDLVAKMDGYPKSHTKAVKWGIKAKKDHQHSVAIVANPRGGRSWRQRFLG